MFTAIGRVPLMRRQIRVQTRRGLEALDIDADDILAEHIQVKIILVVAKRLLNLVTRCDEAEVDECSDADSRDGVPAKVVCELEREQEEVEPDGGGCARRRRMAEVL